MKDHYNLNYILCFFCIACGVALIAGLCWLPVPKENQNTAALAMGFITGTLVGIPLAYIFGGNPTPKKPNEPITDLRTENIN